MSDTRPNESDPSLNGYGKEIFRYTNDTYICTAIPGTAIDFPGWQIKKISKTDSQITITFPNGNPGFIHKASNHLDYSYK